jgi:hypothetical protein
LADVVAPDPERQVNIEAVEIKPENGLVPVEVRVLVGPVMDQNGHIVPDGTPVEIKATLNRRLLTTETVDTQAGLAETELTLTEPGEIEISALAGQSAQSQIMRVSVLAPPTPTFTPVTPTPSPTPTPTVTPDPTSTATATPSPTLTPSPTPALPVQPPPAPVNPSLWQSRRPDGVDLLSALSATLLAGLLGFWLGRQSRQPLSRRLRLGLCTIVGGLLAYLLYGAGWLRPEQWLIEQPDALAGRLAVAGLAFVFSLAVMGLSGSIKKTG